MPSIRATNVEKIEAEGSQSLDRTIRGTNVDRVITVMSTLASIQTFMESIEEAKLRYQYLLYEPSLLVRHRKDFIAFLAAVIIYNGYKTSGSLKPELVRAEIEKIRQYDSILAEEIETLLPQISDKTDLFAQLLNQYKNGRDYFISYIATHLDQLNEKAKLLKNYKLSQQLVALFSAISGQEIEALMKCKGDCEYWLYYADNAGYNIEFFINRINLFLIGWIQNNERVRGLYRDFEDADLRKRMLNNNSVKNLWFYTHQIEYLKRLIAMCSRAYQSGDWNNGFYGKKGFWTDFDKYAKAFEKGYGNSQFKNELIAIERKTENELPQFWGGVWERSEIQDINKLRQQNILYMVDGGVIYIISQEGVLTRLLSKLYSRKYQINNVIHPAAAALMKIFEDRENELKASRNKYVDELLQLLKSAIGISQELTKLARLLRRRLKSLLKKLKKDMNEFADKLKEVFLEYDRYMQNFDKSIRKLDFWYIDEETGKLLNASQSYSAYVKQQLGRGRLFQEFADFVRTTAIDAARAEARFRRWQIENFNHLTGEDFANLQALIQTGWPLLQKMRTIYAYITQKIGENYILEPAGINNFEISAIKNPYFQFSYVKRTMKRVI